MIGKSKNVLLQKTEQAIAAKVRPDLRKLFQHTVLNGETIMYSPKTRKTVMGQLKQSGDPATIIGEGVVKLMGLLMAKSKGTMPPNIAIPAATVLMCEALDFAEKAGMVKVNQAMLAKTTHVLTSALMQMMGITPARLNSMMQSAQNRTTQPANTAQPAPSVPPPPAGIVAQTQGAPA